MPNVVLGISGGVGIQPHGNECTMRSDVYWCLSCGVRPFSLWFSKSLSLFINILSINWLYSHIRNPRTDSWSRSSPTIEVWVTWSCKIVVLKHIAQFARWRVVQCPIFCLAGKPWKKLQELKWTTRFPRKRQNLENWARTNWAKWVKGFSTTKHSVHASLATLFCPPPPLLPLPLPPLPAIAIGPNETLLKLKRKAPETASYTKRV